MGSKKEEPGPGGKFIASTPRGENTEDPYGFGKIVSPEAKSMSVLNDSPEQTKTEERKGAGKMNFLNRLKKTASPTIAVNSEMSPEKMVTDEEGKKGGGKEGRGGKEPFKLVVTGVKNQNQGKDKLLKSIVATKEELEGMEAQFEVEEDEDAKAEWGKEVASLREKLGWLERDLRELDERELVRAGEEEEPRKEAPEEGISRFEAAEEVGGPGTGGEEKPVLEVKRKGRQS